MSFYHQNGPIDQKGSQNFKKVPLDILEINVVSKFGPIPMKIAAGSLSKQQQKQQTFQYPSILIYLHPLQPQPTNIPQYSTTNLLTFHSGTTRAVIDVRYPLLTAVKFHIKYLILGLFFLIIFETIKLHISYCKF